MMISFKRLSGHRDEEEGRAEPLPPQKPARELWSVEMEPMSVGEESVYALTFHRKGTSIYYLHRHFRSRTDADREAMRIHRDLALSQMDFENKYALDVL